VESTLRYSQGSNSSKFLARRKSGGSVLEVKRIGALSPATPLGYPGPWRILRSLPHRTYPRQSATRESTRYLCSLVYSFGTPTKASPKSNWLKTGYGNDQLESSGVFDSQGRSTGFGVSVQAAFECGREPASGADAGHSQGANACRSEVDSLCGVSYGQSGAERMNHRNRHGFGVGTCWLVAST
jgi:hypothetical protein